ncbi:MAG: pantoate--beta-alanine ligase [Bdellovibrionales bacterium]|nr:pantoate--beta-alanine ligase [Bdellovibrionales bacterium]
MKIVSSLEEIRKVRKAATGSVGFVPTMGALHEGHLALVQEAKKRAERVYCSIFVNPLQFGPSEDLSRYPRPFEEDVQKLRDLGVDVLFAPNVDEMTPAGATVFVDEDPLTKPLCGMFRPGHFRGVATIVTKLFNLIRPDTACFGEKDFQQLRLIEKMSLELNQGVEIIRVPTFREKDGLALSSRNRYLSPEHRALAPFLHQTMVATREKILKDHREGAPFKIALNEGRRAIDGNPAFRLQYFEARDEEKLELADGVSKPARIFVAAYLGQTRLIDNLRI